MGAPLESTYRRGRSTETIVGRRGMLKLESFFYYSDFTQNQKIGMSECWKFRKCSRFFIQNAAPFDFT